MLDRPSPQVGAGAGHSGTMSGQGGGSSPNGGDPSRPHKLPPVTTSARSEYSTIRAATQQPSSKMRTWDSRKATPVFKTPMPPNSQPPLTPRPGRSSLAGGSASFSSSQPLRSEAYPHSARGSRPLRDTLFQPSGSPPQSTRSHMYSTDLFSLDDEEISSFNLGELSSMNSKLNSAAAATMKGPPRKKQEEEEVKQVDQTPAHLLQIRQMYAPVPKAETPGDNPQRSENGDDAGDAASGHNGSVAELVAGSENGQGGGSLPEIVVQEEFDEEAHLKRELAQLKTGEDVIAFFAKNGSNTPVKFVYCKRRELQNDTEFRPYDLEVIQELIETKKGVTYTSSMLGEHFTISATGVVYVCPNQQSEYMSLGDWMHHCLMHSVLTSMGFFKYYLHGKVFRRWRLHTRYTVYCHHRTRLTRRLFLAKPLFVGPMVQLHRLMHEVESVKVMNIGNSMYQLQEFARDQATVRSNPSTGAAKELEGRHDAAVAILDKLLRVIELSTEPCDGGEDQTVLRTRMKSMVQEKKEARDNERRHQLALHDQAMLGDCIRLVDYMLQSCLVKIVIRAAVDFSYRVETTSKMFVLQVNFGESNMVFEPSLNDFLQMLTELWSGTIQVVNSVPSFLTVRQYDPLIKSKSTQTVASILSRDNDYLKYTEAIRERIRADISAAQRYSDKNFAVFRPIHEYGLKWNEDDYIATERTHEELAADMHLMKEFQQDLERFKPHHPVGIITVDGKNIRVDLTKVPEVALNVMKNCLAEIARRKCAEANQIFDNANRLLDDRPKHLGQYADFVRNYHDIRGRQESMDQLREEVESMYQLLKQYHVRNTMDDVTQLEILHTRGNDFTHKKVVEAHQFIMDKKEEMIDNLSTVSYKIEDDAREILESLKKGHFLLDVTTVNLTADAVWLTIKQNVEAAKEELASIQQTLSKLEERSSTYTDYQNLFNIPNSFEYRDIEKAKTLFANKDKLFTLAYELKEQEKIWTMTDLTKLDVEKMNKQIMEYSKLAFQLTRSLEGDQIATFVRKTVEEWKERMPVIMDLGNPAMKSRHMTEICKKIGLTQTNSMVIVALERHRIFEFKDFVSEVSGRATGEQNLENQLTKIEAAWEEMLLPVMNHRGQSNLWILADIADIITLLEDHSVQIQTIMGSRFVTNIVSKVEKWEQKIRLASDTLDEWIQVQRAWMYLESIFSAEDIQKQLPDESQKFKHVDKFWKDTLKKVRQSYRTAMDAFSIPNILPQLKKANQDLDSIQKSLEAYLETKRAAFPRFYFLSNDELLSILSQTRNPQAVQEHLCKCFDAINRVTFTQDKKQEITEMSDMIKEVVAFHAPVTTQNVAVEKWLSDIEVKMVESLRALTQKAVQQYPPDGIERKDWLFGAFPSQSILAVDQIMWTHCAEKALDRIEAGDADAMIKNVEFTKKQLEHSVSLVRLNLSKLQRVLMGALIVLDVHGIAVLENLQEAKCSSRSDFDWSKQLRYYWVLEDVVTSDGSIASDDCVIRQTIASMRYSHEYLGNTPRLVVTPLTDKCYMTLTGAIHLNYGGAPAGPAGTGKTETTKDLGKALAVPVVVFNCSDGLDYKIMGRFFSGLAQAGAWACFDEFNRIQVEVLSVIAQQMLTVTQAIRAKKDAFEFLGGEIPLNRRFGVFITMNPGYAGRAELPDNLKSLFRPVAMMVPDYALIAEIMLYSEGFGDAKKLSRKMVSLYSLSSEQLSKQDHYDFGMRAVKSVLVMAGQLKRKYPDLGEDITLIRALRDSNVPKFLSFDLPLFAGIIGDLYPNAVVPFVDYGALQQEIEQQLRKSRLQIVPAFVGKIIQLLETQLVRHGVMVVGLTFIGKSTNIKILGKALTQLRNNNSPDPAHQLTKTFNLNPKSITMEELYGSFNLITGEWTDGLVACLVREAVSDSSENKKWVVFDGPVDAIWIENMNTVLDDNKMLCLSNGERIKLPSTMTMLFEVQDLVVASPATVSRCGMVYLEPVQLGWKPLVQSWAENFADRFPGLADMLKKWTIDICEKALPFIRRECHEAPGIPSVDGNLVTSFLRLLTALVSSRHGFKPLEKEKEGEGKDGKEGKEGKAEVRPNSHQGGGPPKADKKDIALAKVCCAFAAIWSLGANLHENSRGKFQEFLKGPLQSFCSETPDADLYSVCINEEEATFQSVSSQVPTFEFNERVPFFNILVPTVETTLQRLLTENLMHAGFHVLFSGETGVGKSVGIQQITNQIGEAFTVASATFSAQTSSASVVDFLENRLERKRKNLLGAPPGKMMILCVDDLNMPMLEKFGAQPPVELLRQVVDYRGFYDRKKLFWKVVADTQFIAACGPPGGGRMEVTPRLIRHFNMVWMTSLPEETMNRILNSILSGWLSLNAPELVDLSRPITAASVDIFFRISAELLPTPVKCHYTFNLRDPAKMLQGVLSVSVKSELKDKDSLIRLWLHECCRQFRDRLVNDEDRVWFNNKLVAAMGTHFDAAWPIEAFDDLAFGDFFDRGEKAYVRSPGDKKMLETFNDFLDEYNSMNAGKMNLVFFKDAQQHLVRVARILRQPRGNALLVGVSGVGRKSMARMAAHMSSFACTSIEITRNYGTNEFREDLKSMMMTLMKEEGRGLVFLFSDTQIVKEAFLEDINNVLNTGEVPNLFAPDEVEQILTLTKPLAIAAGKVEARGPIWAHFVQVVREALHIVLAFSPIGEGFRARCRQFPSIINCSSIDWYDPWPEDALLSVAERYYKLAPKELQLDSLVPQLSQVSAIIHASSKVAAEDFFSELRRRTYMTPTSYLELIRLFTDLLSFKKGDLTMKLSRYKVGAQRLDETKVIVDKLKVDLTQMQPVIEQGKKDTAELIVQVDKEEAIAREKATACEADEKEASQAAAAANEIKTECQRELDEALPEYHAAIKSLDALDKKDIQEVKSFPKPPALVEVVLNAVCLLFGKKESWDEAKKLMNDTQFLTNLREYDKDGLAGNMKLTAKLQRYIKQDDFQPEKVKKVSGAAMSLCMWVRAMDVYARVVRAIEPKKEKLKSAEATLQEAESKLFAKKSELKAVQDKVAGLQLQLTRAKDKAQKLETDAETCKVKLVRAEKLLGGLGSEATSWEAKSKVLDKSLVCVVGNITLAAGFIAYAGAFTADFRSRLIARWLAKANEVELATDPNWKCADVLVDPSETREWCIKSLPSDDLSIENGILVTRGRRWPLMVDPQGQGNRWIKHMKKDKNVGVIKLTTPNFLRTLESGIREGNPILLENVEEVLDPALEPVLLKQIFKRGGQWVLRLGSEDVPYNDDFRFYITTKLANPHYLPEICIKVTVINFTVTLGGLEDQLVVDVVANERPDLAELRASLVVQIAADKAEMDRLEQLILKLLSEAGNDLLADDTLIVTLDQSKQTSASCAERMASADESMKEIDEVTETFRPVARRASILYFVVADLSNMDPMYQYSLQYFSDLFQTRLQLSEKSDEFRKRIEILIDDFTNFIYVNICRGLFEDHKLLFSFLITAQINRNKEHAAYVKKDFLSPSEWNFFLHGLEAAKGVLEEDVDNLPAGPPSFPAIAFKKLQVLEKLMYKEGVPAFEGLTEEMTINDSWRSFAESDSIVKDALPGTREARLTKFQRLLLVKAFREDLLHLAVRRFVGEELGENYTVSPNFDLAGCFQDSHKMTPLIFILSSGADPTDALLKLAKDKGYEDKLHFISLGQGQGEKAERLIKLGRDSGDWVCLQNCHLAASWMSALERIQEEQDPGSTDDMYRLWLTSMPSPTFPVPVLQSGIKITNEPPKGLRANLMRTFGDITPEIYEGCSKSREYKKLLFALGFFHAAILERRKYGPIGWNVPYEWMDSDFQVSREQVQMYLESQAGVPWVTLTYIIAEVNYGGRVTDDKDVRLISAFLARYFNENILQDGYKLSPMEEYEAPPEGSLAEVREYVRGLPMDEDPQVYGLHSNAQITAQAQSAKHFLETIISVQPRMSSEGASKKPEDLVTEMAERFLARVPDQMKASDAHPETYKKTPEGGIVSLGVFHNQEMDRFNALLGKVRSTLGLLGNAIKGLVVMSWQLEEMYNAFLLQRVPPVWGEPVAYPCLKPLNSWFEDLLKRIDFMSNWLKKGPPVSFWVPCFYFPQGFMTSSKQVHARKTKIPIDSLAFWTEPTAATDPSLATPQEEGQNVHGFFLQGCGWSLSRNEIQESEKGVLFVDLPVVYMKVVLWEQFEESCKQPGRYKCPLYKTSLRKGTLLTTGHSTNFVTYFHLPSAQPDQGHWIRQGVALLCMLDD